MNKEWRGEALRCPLCIEERQAGLARFQRCGMQVEGLGVWLILSEARRSTPVCLLICPSLHYLDQAGLCPVARR